MSCFHEDSPGIIEINTEIKPRACGYKDLHLSIKLDNGKCNKYRISSDSRFEIEDVKREIDGKPVDSDLSLSEDKERQYLYITVGDGKVMRVTGEKID